MFSASLYPTWFRWKFFIKSLGDLRHHCLYIPHGSDERCYDKNQSPKLCLSLYPTWFRWKENCRNYCVGCTGLYIPHGSDESNKDLTSPLSQHTLYPTWFRWKKRTSFSHHHPNGLYIPHGSDESSFPPCRVLPYNPSLYPTWFRWKCYSSAWYFS